MATREQLGDGVVRGELYRTLDDGRFECEQCPRLCRLAPGQRGFCYVRGADAGGITLHSYGRASGFCLDPIEKKPLNHFLPGSSVLSFGTAGCNLGCRFCQNWDISKARAQDRLLDTAGPEDIARAALEAGARSVAFTYNDPVIFAEYAIDCAEAARAQGLCAVAVTAGYATPAAAERLFAPMDAVNVDLKAFTDEFYRRQCYGALEPVKETLRYLVHDTEAWVEITTLLIPGHNDSEAEVDALVHWIGRELGSEVPLHFSAFHPDFRMRDVPPTPPETLRRARQQARSAGLRHVYTGNVHDPDGQSTYCAGCGSRVIERDWYSLGHYGLDAQGHCDGCGTRLAGRFDAAAGSWGRRRRRLDIVPRQVVLGGGEGAR